ncbi:MAG: hypothetical protein D3910_03680 [Candidatus Electrothrix sp. ATG2]|nr:hypothetical protein [Candidatus Electrothrix sp. ATG2]
MNRIDLKWLKEALAGCDRLLTLDNHYVTGGQGLPLKALLASSRNYFQVKNLGVSGVPECGTNAEVLHAHGLDAHSLAKVIRNLKSFQEWKNDGNQ